MSGTNPIGTQIVKEAIKRFPNSPGLTLAKKVYKENPKVFTNIASVRNSIAYHRGQRKASGGNTGKDISLHKEKTYDTNPFKLPESWYEAPKEHKLPIGCNKVLWLSDFQNPFTCQRSIEAAFNYGINNKANAVILNGDVFDHFATSRHDKDPRKINWKKEKELNVQLLESIRSAFPNAVIWFKDGNHEKNKIKYFQVKAPEIYDEEFHNIAYFYQLDKYRIKSITGNDTIKVGNLTAWHGDEFMGGGGNVNPAKNYFEKVKTDIIVSHVHKSSSFAITDYYGKLYRAYTIGALCGLKPKWMAVNYWNNGFGFQEVDPSGEYDFRNIRIDGKKLTII